MKRNFGRSGSLGRLGSLGRFGRAGLIALAMTLLLASFAACGNSGQDATTATTTTTAATTTTATTAPAPDSGSADAGAELALITDLGTIDDKSFNQGSWEGLVQYAEEAEKTHKYYQPSEQSDDAYLNAIDLAITGGAKLIVTPGFLFGLPIYQAQDRYPDVSFVLVDETPHNEDSSDYHVGPNTVSVLYAEEQAGFLAGYAAVKDGMTSLGFMGGMAVPAVVRYGYGFIQGADYAANEMGKADGDIKLNYHYTGNFNASPEAQTLAASWYNDGVEVIFACGGAVGNSVMAAAEAAGAKVIGVDVDQSGESPTVITSAMKGLKASVYDCVKKFYESGFPGGETLVFSAENRGVELAMDTAKFAAFSSADYEAIYARLAANEIELTKDQADGVTVNTSDVVAPKVVVTEIN